MAEARSRSRRLAGAPARQPSTRNALVRGSGHSFAGPVARQGSIFKLKRRGSGAAGREATAVFDMVLLGSIGEDAVVRNLVALYDNDVIYSYIGNVVLSVNPFRPLPIYGEDTVALYRGRSAFDPKLQPHIFALADNVYGDLKYRGRDQVVIISGESGAGKTEASKRIMEYIAAVSGNDDKVSAIKARLLASNPILEAFGNAKTTRNDNSSRFGKYMDMQFDYHGDPAGGLITTYLLEKARVCRQAAGERNFHIFYQLLAGPLATEFGLDVDASKYHFLRQGGSERVRGMNDKDWWRATENAMKDMGFSPEERCNIFRALAGILLLGDVTFAAAGSAGASLVHVPSALTSLLGVSDAGLRAALVHNTVVVNTQQISSDLTPAQAADARDALAKAAYQRLFAAVCERINQHISADKKNIKAVIGVLDIYGFEIFQSNSFEQFCINYCNEKLQQLFIEQTLKVEQEEYAAEEIPWTPIAFFNNKIICDLIESKPSGMISLLDEEGTRPGEKSDKAWLERMTKAVGSHAHFKARANAADRTIPENSFVLKHYAGDVTYSVVSFLDKNADALYKDLSRLMFSSSNPVLKSAFPEGDETTWAGAAKRPPTAGRSFLTSMALMVDNLTTKIPSYVRTIKPNHQKAAKVVDEELVRHQVKYLGLVENVRVRRAGYCFRETYKDFLWRYRCLSEKTFPHWSGTAEAGAAAILEEMNIGPGAFQMGKTKVFIKNPNSVFTLEQARDDMLEVIVTRLQVAWRAYRIRKEIQSYYATLLEKFIGANSEPQFGRRIAWPAHSPVLNLAASMLKRVFLNWWARKTVGTLTTEQQSLWRVQLLAHGFFKGRKQGFTMKAVYSRGYSADIAARSRFELSHGSSLFDDDVRKLSRKLKVHPRVLLLTKTSLFRLDGKFTISPRRVIDLLSIKSVIVSKFRDSIVVIQNRILGDDVIVDVSSSGASHVGEFVARLYVACRDLQNKIKVVVAEGDSIKFNNTGDPEKEPRELVFRENPAGAITLFRGAVVLY